MSATSPTAVPSFRSRIGSDARSGYYAARAATGSISPSPVRAPCNSP